MPLAWARKHGKRRTFPVNDLMLTATEQLPPEMARLLAAPDLQLVVRREVGRRAAKEMARRIEEALMHGTAEQRQERTRAAVRANLSRANKEA